MKSVGLCIGLLVGLCSLPALAAADIQLAQATPAAPAPEPGPAIAPPIPGTSAPAAAKPAKTKLVAKPKPGGAAKKVPSAITVENKRDVTLKSLQIALSGGGGKVVGKLAKPVAGGKTARVALKGAKGCDYDVKWEFEDAGDESTADLCNDPRIVLTD
jgi:hypothetical protein